MTLNPFRGTSTSSSSSIPRDPGVDRGVEAFKRLMFAKSKEGSSKGSDGSEGTAVGSLAPAAKIEETTSLRSLQTEHSTTGMTFVYTSDEEDDVDDIGSSVKHSPETLRTSPQPMNTAQTIERRNLTLTIPLSSPVRPLPPPSRKRGASGSNVTNPDERISDKGPETRRSLPPAPPAPRRTASSASTSHRNPDKPPSIRREPSLHSQPPPP
jgi:hypothetical protein